MAMSDRTIPKKHPKLASPSALALKGSRSPETLARSVSCMSRPTPRQALTNDTWRLSRSCLVSPIRLPPMKQGGHCG
jgi:hypothetical protein